MKKINILNVDYKVYLMDDKKKWEEIEMENGLGECSGFVNIKTKKIFIFKNYFLEPDGAGNDIKHTHWAFIEKTLWHEIGHAVEFESPTSIAPTEFIPTMAEFICNIYPQIDATIKEWKKKEKK